MISRRKSSIARIEILFDRLRDAVNFVDEENVALLHVGQQAGQIAGFFDHRPRSDAHVLAELVS